LSAPHLAEYEELLIAGEKLLEARHLTENALLFRAWRKELKEDTRIDAVKKHATRTARSLGGMESIGEIALARHDRELLSFVESLYATCEDIISS
jgi:hypothetical protein